MKWTGLNELRELFLAYFEEKGHLRLPSYPLVPIDDNSLFLINSGMAPMKKFFTGAVTPPRNRVTTCQKCIRTPDIENVGKTARHGTFFEMLGNFSFGDYFKSEAIAFAWEFFTKTLDMPVDKLHVSIYLEDDQAYDIWANEIGVDPSHIVRLGKADNFWEHGTGPCGPCSEIYFDRGDANGCGSPDCKVGCECDRYVEVWNNVFSQFDSDGNGNYAELATKNIDTGMGLERLACIMQEVNNLFEVDTIQNIMTHISDIAGIKYKTNEKNDISLRVITDHIRSTVFMLADGVIPSNEGRGYVLRRLLRRAARHGRLLGINKPFLYEVVDTVAKENEKAYPELLEKVEYVKKMVKSEEDNFSRTVDNGFELLNQIISKMDSKVFSGEDAFKLYDTYGFPIDLTKEILDEQGLTVDEEGFTKLMEEQRVRARNARNTGDAFGGDSDETLAYLGEKVTSFVGYDRLTTSTDILGIIVDGQRVDTAISPQNNVIIITNETTFYAESGGQVGDLGTIKTKNGTAEVYDVKKAPNGNLILHYCNIITGQINEVDTAEMEVSENSRLATARNHTGAHLLQAALRKVLGDHVHQAGQLVNDKLMRFDFSHFEGMTKEQLQEVENEVNRIILLGIQVDVYETDIDTAKSQGAMALFGEKYGNIVRICKVSDFSMELCGGTHIDNTSKIGLFKILSESSVAAGVRRIEALTGAGVLEYIANLNTILVDTCNVLKAPNINDLVSKAEQITNEVKDKNSQLDKLNQKLANSKVDEIFANIQHIGDIPYISSMFTGTNSESLKIMADSIKEKAPNLVSLIAGVSDDKATLMCVCGENAVKDKKLHAGKIVSKAAAITGGKGGGRPDVAMAGVADKTKIDEALLALPDILKELLG